MTMRRGGNYNQLEKLDWGKQATLIYRQSLHMSRIRRCPVGLTSAKQKRLKEQTNMILRVHCMKNKQHASRIGTSDNSSPGETPTRQTNPLFVPAGSDISLFMT